MRISGCANSTVKAFRAFQPVGSYQTFTQAAIEFEPLWLGKTAKINAGKQAKNDRGIGLTVKVLFLGEEGQGNDLTLCAVFIGKIIAILIDCGNVKVVKRGLVFSLGLAQDSPKTLDPLTGGDGA